MDLWFRGHFHTAFPSVNSLAPAEYASFEQGGQKIRQFLLDTT